MEKRTVPKIDKNKEVTTAFICIFKSGLKDLAKEVIDLDSLKEKYPNDQDLGACIRSL